MHLRIWMTLFLTLSGVHSATAQDYWRCDGGKWVAEGQPAFSAPTLACGDLIPPLPETKAECLAIGGSWGRYGIRPNETCLAPTTDAGRVCGDSAECESMCVASLTAEQETRLGSGQILATTGQCTPYRPNYGCMSIVNQGVVRGTLCVD